MKLDEQFNGICTRYLEITAQYDKMAEAFKAFCDEKNQLAALLLPHAPNDDGQEPSVGTTPEPYPSETDKANIRDTVSEISDVDLAVMLRNTKPDLGALSDEMRVVFIARTALDEAAKRLEARKEAQ